MSERAGPYDVEEFYLAAWPRLVSLLIVVTGSRPIAEEVAQDAFVRLLPKWETVSTYDEPELWLRHVALRLVSTRRRNMRRRGGELTLFDGIENLVGGLSSGPEMRLDMLQTVSALPMHQRQVVALFYLCDLTVDEVAITLNLSPGTVKSRLSRARSNLAGLLKTDVEDRYV